MAHAALSNWIVSRRWQANDRGAELVRAFDFELKSAGFDNGALPNVAQMRKRLELRAGALADVLEVGGPDAQIKSEVLLQDPERKIYGYADIIVRGDSNLVLDLKTGERASSDAELPEADLSQLLLYAYLMTRTFGEPIAKVVRFTLRGGAQVHAVEPGDLERVVSQALALRGQAGDSAAPSVGNCRFCRMRASCEPHWAALPTWDRKDAVRGVVRRVERAANGAITVSIMTDVGLSTVRRLASDVALAYIRPGASVAFLRVRYIGEERGATSWEAGTWTSVVSGGLSL